MINDIVGRIGKERIDHIALITGEIDPHSYELVKGDDEKLKLAQVIFYNGLGLEHGASLRYQLEHHPEALSLGNLVMEKDPSLILYAGKEVDPHIWMDISLWARIVNPIVEKLSQLDPEGAPDYRNNAAALLREMNETHQQVYKSLQAVPQEKRYLVTSHDAFNYFTRAYLATPNEKAPDQWSARFEAPEGLAPEGQLSAYDIQAVIDHLIKYHIQTVFPESNVSRDSLKKVIHACSKKGLTVEIAKESLYSDSMGEEGSETGTYMGMMRYDCHVLTKGWK